MTSIFLSYSRADESWMKEIRGALEAAGANVEVWTDEQIGASGDWDRAIQKAMRDSAVAVLLVSNNSLRSKYIRETEVPRMLSLANFGLLGVVPVLLSACPLPEWLPKRQILPAPNRPLDELGIAARQRAIAEIVHKIASLTSSYSIEPRKPIPAPKKGFLGRVSSWVAYLRIRKKLDAAVANHSEQQLGMSAAPKLAAPFQVWPSRAIAVTSDARFVVITGSAGLGKSTLVRDLARKQALCGAMILAIPISELSRGGQSFDERMWHALLTAAWNAVDADRKTVAAALPEILRRRRVLLVVEDVHNFGAFGEFRDELRQYFENQHGSWSRGVCVLASTREEAVAASADVSVGSLEPLTEDEARTFFLACTKELSGPWLEALLKNAFTTPRLRTPLFVYISATLCVQQKGSFEQVARILHMKAADLLREFISLLIHGRAEPDPKVVREAYVSLALANWPRSESLIVEDVLSREMTAELILRSLLHRDCYGALEQIAFPHQAIADYLVGRAVLDNGDFARLDGEPAIAVEGVHDFMTDLAGWPQLMAFFAHDLRPFVRKIARDPGFLSQVATASDLVEQLTSVIGRWAGVRPGTRERGLTDLQWKELFDALDDVLESWRAPFLAAVRHAGPSAAAARLLLRAGGAECRNVVTSWLRDDAELFGAEADPAITAFLIDLIRDVPLLDRAAWHALLRIVNKPSREQALAIVAALKEQLPAIADAPEALERLVRLNVAAVVLLAYAAANHSPSIIIKVEEAVTAVTGKLLLLPRSYEGIRVVDHETQHATRRDLMIERPLLVPLKPVKLTGRDWDDVSTRARTRARADDLWTYDEFCVVYGYYWVIGAAAVFDFPTTASEAVELIRHRYRTGWNHGFVLVRRDGHPTTVVGTSMPSVWYREVKRLPTLNELGLAARTAPSNALSTPVATQPARGSRVSRLIARSAADRRESSRRPKTRKPPAGG